MFENDAELQNIRKINAHLFADRFCVPPYNSINGKWISECFHKINAGKFEELKYQVTSQVILPWRRAYQTTYYYTELPPFKPLVKVIDAATLAYFHDNFFCAYMAILPVIEGVIDRWGSEIPGYNPFWGVTERAKYILEFAKSRMKSDVYFHHHLLLQHEYLLTVLKEIFFTHGTKYIQAGNADAFNRNVIAHLLDVPDYFSSNVHTLRIFLLLDIIAILYAHSHPEKFIGYSPVCDLEHKPDMINSYFGIYKSCAIRTINEGSYNLTLENRIYSDQTDGKEDRAKAVAGVE